MKVALYVRVSTQEQESSIINQRQELKRMYPNDDIVIYQDFGISGTKISNREGFIQMMKDAGLKQHFITKKKFVFIADELKEPLFDKIITKSITRFARNTDILNIWKELNQKKVTVLFQDINKDTGSSEDSLLLNLLLTLSQEESKNISERTKFGNIATANANIIRGNGLYGYYFDRENNSLKINEEEAKVVRKMFKLCIDGFGYNKISEILAEEGLFNKKGKPFATGTIKNMIHNKKYCGYNVRNQWESRNLFSENHSNCRTKKENWIIKKNDRIDEIISEKDWEAAMRAVNERLLHQNTGKGITKRDTRNKVICGCCGMNFYICHSKKINSAINSYPYYICATKKKKGKNVCNVENITLKKIDKYIDDLARNYYKNIKIQGKFKLVKLKLELQELKKISIIDINNEIVNVENSIEELEEKMSSLIDSFTSETSEILKKIVKKKLEELEFAINNENNKLIELRRIVNNSDEKKLELESKIKRLNKELEPIKIEPLTRAELMEKISFIKVNKNNKLVVEYK